jgi:hyaluronoglucosaminidase
MRADIPIPAGVIEGFFGRPWDWPARLSVAGFLRDCGYDFYIYAPKADPFLRRRWREPLPAQTQQHLSQLGAQCRSCGISFGIGLTPFEIYLDYGANARASLRSKVLEINDIGPEILCILFDDMRGDVDGLPGIQGQIIADVSTWSSAGRFIVCPTYYSFDPRLSREFGLPARDYLRDFGRVVDPGIDIFWTGEKIISEGYSAGHLAAVAAEIGRKPFIWDNYISNDSKTRTNHLFLDPTMSAWHLPADLAAGLAINPMNQPHLSRIALCAFRRLLVDTPGGRQVPPDVCREFSESPFAARLLADGVLFRETALDQLDGDTRLRLLDWYGTQSSNACAREVAAWLRGEYLFDPECLTA